MIMKKLARTITMHPIPNTTAERVVKKVHELEAVDKMLVQPEMRRWIQAGFSLSEIGHGIMEGWLSLCDSGKMDKLSSRQKADVLKNLIDRTLWLDDEVHEQTTPAPKKEVRRTPVKKPEPEPVQEQPIPVVTTGVAGMPKGFQLADF